LCAGSPRCLTEAVRRRVFDRALRGTVSGADELARTLFGPDQPNMTDLSAAGAVPEAAPPETLTKG